MVSKENIFLALFIYTGILYFVANWAKNREAGKRFAKSSFVYAMGIAVYFTSWTFYGSVGKYVNSGWQFFAIHFGPLLFFLFGQKLLVRLVKIKNDYRVSSIADLLALRYGKSQGIAALVTIVSLIGILPYISLQLKSVIDTLVIISDVKSYVVFSSFLESIIVVIFITFTILFGLTKLDLTDRHPGLMTAISFEAIYKFLIIIVAGIYVTYILFDGYSSIIEQLPTINFGLFTGLAGDNAPGVFQWITYAILGFTGIILLPRQFHVTIVENSDSKQIGKATIIFIILVIIANFFTLAFAAGGLLKGLLPEAADSFVLRLPMMEGNSLLSIAIFLGGFSAAMSMIIISGVTLSTMTSHHLLMPALDVFPSFNFLKKHILKLRWLFATIIILFSYILEEILFSELPLVSIGIISFAAILQFAPAFFGGLFWKGGNKQGAFAGISIGFLLWIYTLLIPHIARIGLLDISILETGPFDLIYLAPEKLFGFDFYDSLTHSVFWSLLVNSLIYIGISKITQQSSEEKKVLVGFSLSTDVFYPDAIKYSLEQNILLRDKLYLIEELLSQYISSAAIAINLNKILDNLDFKKREYITVVDLSKLQVETEKYLAGSIGASAAFIASKKAEIITQEEKNELSRVYGRILADLNIAPNEITKRIDYYRERAKLVEDHARELERKIEERDKEIIERMRVEAALRKAEEKYRSIYENSVEGIYQTSLDGKILSANPASARILGYTSVDDLISSIKDLAKELYVTPSRREELISLIEEREEVRDFEVEYYRKDKSKIWCLLNIRGVKDNNNKLQYFEGTFFDITERKEAEATLIKAKNAAEKADRIKTNFLAQMSHEIRTPVNTILNFTNLLEEELRSALRDEHHEFFNIISSGGDRIIRTIDLILNMSELQAGSYAKNMQLIDLDKEVISKIVRDQRHKAEYKKIKLIYNQEFESPISLVDEYSIYQTITNLVDNAIKYTKEGNITVILRDTPNTHEITIADTGIGMGEEFMKNIFKPFSQEETGYSRKFEGTGLGLALVKKYCDINNAEISVDSKKNVGSKFIITIPKL